MPHRMPSTAITIHLPSASPRDQTAASLLFLSSTYISAAAVADEGCLCVGLGGHTLHQPQQPRLRRRRLRVARRLHKAPLSGRLGQGCALRGLRSTMLW
jgi:hypothetical protein